MSAKPEHYDLIKKPIITEKATMVSENGAVVFQVAMDATKPQIKEAVEAIFGVKVKAVNTTIIKDQAASRKIRAFYKLHEILHICIRTINQMYRGINHFTQIVCRDIRSHTNRNTLNAVQEEIWYACR